jgi:hypothetical protein
MKMVDAPGNSRNKYVQISLVFMLNQLYKM